MKVSLNWVKEFAKVDLSTEELIALATERLGGVEGYDYIGKHYEGIVVAKVVSCEKHSNADKLNVCKIDDAGAVKDVTRDSDGYVQVVCGAPNVREGLLVGWIPPSAVVPASYGEKELFVLEARDLRGELSNGMLASPRELGLSDDHDGILEITDDVAPGTPFKSLYNLDDVLIDFENKMFTHRPDCFGQLGIAREIAGIQHQRFESPDWYLSSQVNTGHSEHVKGFGVTVENPDLCPRYMAIAIDNIKIGPSPQWLQAQLKRVGLRPINNVVDITNYMMMLTAQPLHAFDFDKIAVNGVAQITVRKPHQGERMTLLDGKTIEPHAEAILICSQNGPIALGGVMGGANSEVDENTTRVLLECATFDMYNIRKTSMEHGIFTDAVTRFNKGQPAAQLPAVLSKTVQIFEEITGAHVVGDVVDASEEVKQNQPIKIGVDLINERLGSDMHSEEIINLLENVEFKVDMGEELTVTAPFWRTDIEIAEDIIEEIGRLYGFNNLPTTLPQRSISPPIPNPLLTLKENIRQTLARAGANEVLTYSFVHGDLIAKAGQDPSHAYKLRNALSPDLQYYRLSILPSLLERVHSNIKAGFGSFGLFELGKVHYKGEMDESEPEVPNEDNHLAFVITTERSDGQGAAFYQARAYLAQIAPELVDQLVPLREFDLSSDEWGRQLTALYEPARSAVVVRDNQIWGVIGEYKHAVHKAFKLPAYTAGFEVNLGVLSQIDTTYTPLSKYPTSTQDLTLKVAPETDYSAVETCLKNGLATTEYQWQLSTLSIFQPDGAEHKNLSFRLTLSHMDHTLTTEEVNSVVADLVEAAHKAVKAKQV